jgi:hypothetical protein
VGATRAAILVQLRAGCCFYADPTTPPRTGRPRRHGHKLQCADPATWPVPAAELAVDDEQSGCVRVRPGARLGRAASAHAGRARPTR